MKLSLPNWQINRWTMLFIGIGALTGGLLVIQTMQASVVQPIRVRLANLQQLDKKLHDSEQQIAHSRQVELDLRGAQQRSLSADPAIVSQLYQQWLLERTSSFSHASVTPLSPLSEDKLGWRVPLAVEGDAPADRIGALVDDLTALPLLHRISYLSIEPVDQNKPNKELHFKLTIDALALPGAVTADHFPQVDKRSSHPIGKLQTILATKRPFDRGYTGPTPLVSKPQNKDATASKPAPAPEVIDPLKSLKLIGSVVINDIQHVWLFDSKTQSEIALSEQQTLNFQNFTAQVTRITRDDITLLYREQPLRWEMGRSLREALDAHIKSQH